MTEKEALSRLKDREAEALEWIMERYAPYVRTVISTLSRDRLSREDAEEIAADVFVRLWRAKELPAPEKLKSYLGAIARNCTLTKLRRQKNCLPLEEETLRLDETDYAELCSGRERERAVRRAVAAMAMPDREIFVRRYYYGQGAAEIARLMALSPEAVRQRLHRGREALRRALVRQHPELEEGE